MAVKVIGGNMGQAVLPGGAEEDLPGVVVPDDKAEVGALRTQSLQSLLIKLPLQIAQRVVPTLGVVVVQDLHQLAVLAVHGLIPAHRVGVVPRFKEGIPVKAAVDPAEGGRYGAGKGEEQGYGFHQGVGAKILSHGHIISQKYEEPGRKPGWALQCSLGQWI